MSSSSTFKATHGAGYELQMGRWSQRLTQPFLDFAGSAAHEQVLDVGCGTGHLAYGLARIQPTARVTGIDYAPAYVEHARQRGGGERLCFEVGDACALRFGDALFDRALALLVLHFVPRSEDAIAEMRRVTKPGGIVAAAVWDARGGFVANRIFFDTAAVLDAKANERRARNYTRPLTRPGELAAAWRAAGLEEVSEASLMIRMDFSDFCDYWAPYAGQDGPGAEYVATLTDDAKARLQDAVRMAYLDGEADGPRSYAALAWAVRGRVPLA